MEGATVITCTIRQNQIDQVLNNFHQQSFQPKELIIVLNDDSLNQEEWIQKSRPYENVKVFRKSQNIPLGACLNFAIQRARYDYIAKFDDDDYYGPGYLQQAIDALNSTEASLVGKDAHTTYFEGKNLLAVMRPNQQNVYSEHVGGGTLVFHKSLFSHVKFPQKTKGEDIYFQQICRQKGFKIYSTDKNHYVSIRRKNKESHTWQAEDEEILWECEEIAYTDDFKPYVDV